MNINLHLFAAACVIALALVSKANGVNQCETLIRGNPVGTPHPLPRKILPPYVKDVIVKIPRVCDFNGIVILICDPNGAPDVEVLSFDTLLIHRKGNAAGVGTVDITEYCNTWDTEAPSKLVPIALPVAPK